MSQEVGLRAATKSTEESLVTSRIFIGIVCALLAGRAAADGSPVSLGGDLSTLGPGLSVSAALLPNFVTAELDGAAIAYSHSVSSDGDTYSGINHMVSVGLIGNIYPLGNPFHVSAGAYYLDQRFPVDMRLQGGNFHINGQIYTPAELTSLTARIDYAHAAPYLGIGWGNPTVKPGWHLSGRLGVVYVGRPRVDFVGVTTLSGVARDDLYNNLDVQRRALRSDLSSLPLYPVVGVSLAYRF